MNRQNFLAELSRLLGFMSSWDRHAEMNKYTEMLDGAEDEQALIESLGTPTQIAISIALNYKPTPKPGTEPPPEPEPGPEAEEQSGTPPEGENAPEAEAEPEREGEAEPPPPPPPPPKKRDELQIVTDGEFEYGMELAILMGEPISAAVESALNGEYLPDPDFSLEEIMRENGADTPEPGQASAAADSEAGPEPWAEETDVSAPGEAPEIPAPEESAPEAREGAALSENAQAVAEPESHGDTSDAVEAPEAGTSPETASESAEESGAENVAETAEVEGASAGSAGDTGEAADASGPETEGENGETQPEEEGSGQSGNGNAGTPETEEETAPVFDAATPPLPEAVRSEEAGQAQDSAGEKPSLVFDPSQFAELPPDEPAESGEPEETPRPGRRLRGGGTAVYVLFALIIGLPMTVLLILVGVPVLMFGGGIILLTVYAASGIIAPMSMFADISLVAGVSLAICGVGLLIAWFGLWVSIELGALWINGVVLRLGRSLCFEKEADAE